MLGLGSEFWVLNYKFLFLSVLWISSKCFNLTPPKFTKFFKEIEKCRHGIRSFKNGRFSGPCFITCFQIVRFKFAKFS
jgi:hypothetical protein